MKGILKFATGTAILMFVFKTGLDIGIWGAQNFLLSFLALALSKERDISIEDAADFVSSHLIDTINKAKLDINKEDLEKARELFKEKCLKDLGMAKEES